MITVNWYALNHTHFDTIMKNFGYKILQDFFSSKYTHITAKLVSCITIYKLTNYKYTNYTLNTASRQGVCTDIILSFNVFYLKIVFLQHLTPVQQSSVFVLHFTQED